MRTAAWSLAAIVLFLFGLALAYTTWQEYTTWYWLQWRAQVRVDGSSNEGWVHANESRRGTQLYVTIQESGHRATYSVGLPNASDKIVFQRCEEPISWRWPFLLQNHQDHWCSLFATGFQPERLVKVDRAFLRGKRSIEFTGDAGQRTSVSW